MRQSWLVWTFVAAAGCGGSGDACKELEAKVCKDLPADECAASMKALNGDTPADKRAAECAQLVRSDEDITRWRRMQKLSWKKHLRLEAEKNGEGSGDK